MLDRLKRIWGQHFLGAELALSVGLVLIFWICMKRFGLEGEMMGLVKGNRGAVYTTVASIAGSLLGFTLTGVAILLALADGGKLGILRRSRHYKYIYKVYMSTIKVLAVATAVSLLGLLYDRENSPQCIVLYFNLWAVMLTCFRILRCVWVLEHIIRIVTRPAEGPAGGV